VSALPERIALRPGVALIVSIVTVVAAALALRAMGHPWICTCGTVKLFSVATGVDNSQHVFDWYTPSHIVHGFLFYLAAWLIFRGWSPAARFIPALIVEAAWEIAEGTPFLQDRYRGATVAVDYFGDSVVNATADILAMIVGYWLAARFPVWLSIAVVVVLEIDGIKTWQAGG
jgi:hypothetical protein